MRVVAWECERCCGIVAALLREYERIAVELLHVCAHLGGGLDSLSVMESVAGFRFKVSGYRFRVSGLRFRVSAFNFRFGVSGLGFQVSV